MARADFYMLEKSRFRDAPLLLVCELARKAHDSGRPTAILARSQAEAEELDDLLWAFDPEAYVPHQIAGREDDDDEAPVLIVEPGTEVPPGRPLLINLRDEEPPGGFERVLEVVPAEGEHRDGSRRRWKTYKARGFEIRAHTM